MTEEIPECPICPECGELLETIYAAVCGKVYNWNDEKCLYEIDDAQESITFFFCGSCEKPIGCWKANGEVWGFLPETDE